MEKLYSIKFKMIALFGGLILVAFIIVSSITSYNFKKALMDSSKSEINKITKLLENNLQQFSEQTTTIVASNFMSFRNYLYSNGSFAINNEEYIDFRATNQVTKDSKNVTLPLMSYGGEPVAGNFSLVDSIVRKINIDGLTTTIFQKIDGGLLRVATNVVTNSGKRAVGTYIPSSSKVYNAVMNGQTYKGRAFVVNQWYWTVHEPIVIDGEVQGVLYMGIAEKILLKTLHRAIENIEIGETGYAYIFDKKGNMVLHPSIEGKNILNLKDSDGKFFIKEMIKEKDGWITYNYKDSKGDIAPKIMRFHTIPDLNWVIAAGTFEYELYEVVNKINRKILLLEAGIFLVILVLILISANVMSSKITVLSNRMKDISGGGGDLTKGIKINSKDELGELAQYVNKFINSLNDIISQVKQSVTMVSGGNNSIVAATEELSASFSLQAEELGGISSSTDEVNTLSNMVMDNISNTESNTANASEQTIQCQSQLNSAIEHVSEIKDEVQRLGESIESLTQSSTEIGQILSVINDIADQTNLLALNAAIEAARAGEAGRGFAVVADEVRKLAEKTQNSTNEINQIISSLQGDTKDLKQRMSSASSSVEKGVENIEHTGEIFGNIVSAVDSISNATNEMSGAVNEQNGSVENITARVSALAIGVEESSNAVRDVAEMLVDGRNQIEALERLMEQFKTK